MGREHNSHLPASAAGLKLQVPVASTWLQSFFVGGFSLFSATFPGPLRKRLQFFQHLVFRKGATLTKEYEQLRPTAESSPQFV